MLFPCLTGWGYGIKMAQEIIHRMNYQPALVEEAFGSPTPDDEFVEIFQHSIEVDDEGATLSEVIEHSVDDISLQSLEMALLGKKLHQSSESGDGPLSNTNVDDVALIEGDASLDAKASPVANVMGKALHKPPESQDGALSNKNFDDVGLIKRSIEVDPLIKVTRQVLAYKGSTLSNAIVGDGPLIQCAEGSVHVNVVVNTKTSATGNAPTKEVPVKRKSRFTSTKHKRLPSKNIHAKRTSVSASRKASFTANIMGSFGKGDLSKYIPTKQKTKFASKKDSTGAQTINAPSLMTTEEQRFEKVLQQLSAKAVVHEGTFFEGADGSVDVNVDTKTSARLFITRIDSCMMAVHATYLIFQDFTLIGAVTVICTIVHAVLGSCWVTVFPIILPCDLLCCSYQNCSLVFFAGVILNLGLRSYCFLPCSFLAM